MRLKKYFILTLLAANVTMAHAQHTKTDTRLQAQLQALVNKFNGTAGIYVRNLKTNKVASVNADTIFPTASVVKVPIMVGLFNKINQGQLQYHKSLVYRDSLAKEGSGIMQFFKDGTNVTVDLLAALMIGYSDNTTSVWCQNLAGGGETINALMDSYGLKNTRVNSRTKGREDIWKVYGWGQTTPREIAELVATIRQGKAVSPAASDEMYRLMTHIYYNQYGLSQIPPYIQAAAKQGMVNDSRSEVMLVNAPHGDYVYYVGTKNIKDKSWNEDTNEAWNLLRQVSALLWHFYEPRDPWQAKPRIK